MAIGSKSVGVRFWRIQAAGLPLGLFLAGHPAQAQSGSPPSTGGPAPEPEAIEALLSQRLTAIETHFENLLLAIPAIGPEFERLAATFKQALGGWSVLQFALTVGLICIAGVAAAFAFRHVTRNGRRSAETGSAGDVPGRLRKVALLGMLNVGEVIAALAALIAAVLLVNWPPGALRFVVAAFLAAGVALHLLAAILRTALGSGRAHADGEPMAMLPASPEEAGWWRRHLMIPAAIFFFGWATAATFRTFGVQFEVIQLMVYALGIGIVAASLHMTWRRPSVADAGKTGFQSLGRIVMTCLIALIWFVWLASAKMLLNLLLVGTFLYLGMKVERKAVAHLLRPAADGVPDASLSPVLVVAIDRIVRAVLIIVAMAVLLRGWNIEFLGIVGGEPGPLDRIVRAAAHALVIVLVVDLVWSIVNVMIKRALAGSAAQGAASEETLRREARLRTLLPILKNIAGVTLFVMGALMALAAFGVEIGPLIAGAGVVGVAVGFGAQTLVRDIFSGIFYMLDDAFRVGEYIQSGNYKGVVESFSLRSVKLRHHRGALFTVPFGQLGAVQNMSRDWVIDKIIMTLAYGSDFEQAKKIIKQVGRELAEDPELGGDIIQPLKMQGMEQFGEYGISIRLKMMTKPGKQFVLRRRANATIKKRFEEAGIKFAMPVVHVAGDGKPDVAAAHQTLGATGST
ncbi:MAG: mechanosensitive ion channel family protein [Reyranellaceae bacterium]